jgi:ATP-dependent Clp protease adaptor protein ClpS
MGLIRAQNRNFSQDSETGTVVENEHKLETPKMFKVLLLNDDFTPMDFVVLVLRRFFAKTEEEASQIMLEVHHKGAGVAGVYSLEIAEMKSLQVSQYARQNQHPLKCTVEAT